MSESRKIHYRPDCCDLDRARVIYWLRVTDRWPHTWTAVLVKVLMDALAERCCTVCATAWVELAGVELEKEWAEDEVAERRASMRALPGGCS